ncbi:MULTISPECIES: hypothetical protein [Prevotella]|nr:MULTISPECIES: hypothetical protein [Prevotella]
MRCRAEPDPARRREAGGYLCQARRKGYCSAELLKVVEEKVKVSRQVDIV